jgi:hypothetical protein
MYAEGKAYEYFRMTPYEDEPVPGSCGREEVQPNNERFLVPKSSAASLRPNG